MVSVGDISNTGTVAEYQLFIDKFFWPLHEILQGSPSINRIIFIPGNHDIARTEVRAVRTKGLLSQVPTFLDPTDEGQSERKVIFPRFKAFTDSDPTASTDHWIYSPNGCLTRLESFGTMKIGILGLNTAWLSGDSDDRHELSAGKTIIEEGLSSLSHCNIIFVLGHHPIDWFLDNEVTSIRTMFARYPVIYLCGHLHKTGGQIIMESNNSFLSVQAGASFYVREDEKWANRIIWGEVQEPRQGIKLTPFFWSHDHQEWALDTNAFANSLRPTGQDFWRLSISSISDQAGSFSDENAKNSASSHSLTPGWRLLGKTVLDSFKRPLSEDEVITFFDGRIPTWADALSEKIPRRGIVEEIVSNIKKWVSKPTVSVYLIKGAGGEGKSTVLRQVIVDLLGKNIVKEVLWNENVSLVHQEVQNTSFWISSCFQ